MYCGYIMTCEVGIMIFYAGLSLICAVGIRVICAVGIRMTCVQAFLMVYFFQCMNF